MNMDVICCCFTCIFSLIVAAFTFCKTKKLNFFNVYFEKKTNAYNEFLDAISHLPYDGGKETPQFVAALHKITLYASDEALGHCIALAEALKSIPQTHQYDSQMLREAIYSFRKDIDDCKKFRFR